MATNHMPSRTAHVAPLILRLAVAAVLAGAGWSRIQTPPRTLDTNPAPVAETPAAPTDATGAPVDETALVRDRTPDLDVVVSADPPRTRVNDEGVAVNLGWQDVIGMGQLGFAAALVLGVLTRIVALLGLCGVTAGALQVGGERLAEMYAANPPAMLLLGAVCLTLLIAGSGPIAIDRSMAKRRHRRGDGEPVETT